MHFLYDCTNILSTNNFQAMAPYYKSILAKLAYNCDVIRQSESELANTVFKPNKADSFFCFLLFVQSFNCLYVWNQLPNLCGIFTKLKP